MDLPYEIENKIYEYDGRYRYNYDKVLNEITIKNNWFLFMKDTLISSVTPYISLSGVYLSELKEVEQLTFIDYYFKKTNTLN
tara:strand:- start:114 stop:359 length:246 start_codon:yes stop_codon:yes gene_type:complete